MEFLDARLTPQAPIIAAVSAVLARGGTVIVPTDTVYGLVCLPNRLEALARIYASKGRPAHKPLSLVCASVPELLRVGEVKSSLASAAARCFLPGPLTLIVPRPAAIAPEVTAGAATLGLRVPAHPWLQQLLEQTGPLASTSANLSGAEAYAGTAVEEAALPEADLFVDAGPTQQRRESSVVDFTLAPPQMLREGALAKSQLATWLRDFGVV